MRLVIIAVVFLGAVTTLITVGVINRGTEVFTFDQIAVAAPGEVSPSKYIKIERGWIVEIVSLAPDLKFRYGNPESPGSAILVESDRNPPDNFRVGIGASLKGYYDQENGVFRAAEVTTNCPTKYESADDLKGVDGDKKAEYGQSGDGKSRASDYGGGAADVQPASKPSADTLSPGKEGSAP